MPETITKMQPNRAIHLRGFSPLGSSGAITAATATSFKVSGHFPIGDGSAFAVCVIHDADDFFSHLRLKPLPDFDFSGQTLTFDVNYDAGLQPLASLKFPTIDWPFLDIVHDDGGAASQINLFEHSTLLSGSYSPATASMTVVASSVQAGDVVRLWRHPNTALSYTAAGGETAETIASALEATVNNTDWPTFAPLLAMRAKAIGPTLTFTAARYGVVSFAGQAVTFVSGINFAGLAVGDTIRVGTIETTITAVTSQTQLTVASDLGNSAGTNYLANRGGDDGNFLRIYETHSSSRLQILVNIAGVRFTGGLNTATWRIALDFDALVANGELRNTQIRQALFTYAPKINTGAQSRQEWAATYTNWALTGTGSGREYADPDRSLTVDSHDSLWAKYSGTWTDAAGFYTNGFAKQSSTSADEVEFTIHSPVAGDLYLGVSLFSDRGRLIITVDDDTPTTLDLYAAVDTQINTRRKIRTGVTAGPHTVVVQVDSGAHADSSGLVVVVDYCQSIVASTSPPTAITPVTHLSAANDYGTDHGYQLSPQRLYWLMDQLGLGGQGSEFISVFWWMQRKPLGGTLPSVTVQFTGTFAAGDQIFLSVGGSVIGKTVFAEDTVATIARHFRLFIGEAFSGVRAGLPAFDTIRIDSAAPTSAAAFNFTFSTSIEAVPGSTGAIVTTGQLDGGADPTWTIDHAFTPPMNPGSVAWHQDWFAEWAAGGRELAVAMSMELVLPDDDPAAGKVYAARYPDNVVVDTATGFGGLNSVHCTFSADMLAYQKAVYVQLANAMAAAGLPVILQFGEFLWWFFTNYDASDNLAGGMAYYDADTLAAAEADLGRAPARFLNPNDPPGDDQAFADFLRSRLHDHMQAIADAVRVAQPTAQFEILFAFDVNHDEPVGANKLGGALNFYINWDAVNWNTPDAAPFDILKVEALNFGSGSRDMNLAREAVEFHRTDGRDWPVSQVRYLLPIFNGGCPWEREYWLARNEQIPKILYWAFDQFCLFSREPGVPRRGDRTEVV